MTSSKRRRDSRRRRRPAPIVDGVLRQETFHHEPEPQLARLGRLNGWSLQRWVALGVMVAFAIYSYWPTIVWMAEQWYIEPDYTHGWFVPFLALSICWHRAYKFPGVESKSSWAGVWIFGLVILMRFVSRMAYADFLDAWSIPVLVAGFVWVLLGPRALWWALPAIVFLFFAIPLPYQAETMLSWQLRGFATELSKFGLRACGYPAVSEGHVIWIADKPLIVEQACSGLRIFVGMGAFAFFWAAINDRSWSDRIFLLSIAIPVAVFVNALRIIVIGLFTPYIENSDLRYWIHEVSGIAMLFASFGIMGAAGKYWTHLYRPEESVTARESLDSGLAVGLAD